MKDLLNALEKKKLWMTKLVSISARFIEEYRSNPDQALEELDTFDQNRESLVKMTMNSENDILKLMQGPTKFRPNEEEPERVRDYIELYEKKLNEMQCIDSEIIQILDTLKIDQKEKLSDLNKGKRALDNYRGNTKNRSNFDVQL